MWHFKCCVSAIVSFFFIFLTMKAHLKSCVSPITGTPLSLYQCLATVLKVKKIYIIKIHFCKILILTPLILLKRIKQLDSELLFLLERLFVFYTNLVKIERFISPLVSSLVCTFSFAVIPGSAQSRSLALYWGTSGALRIRLFMVTNLYPALPYMGSCELPSAPCTTCHCPIFASKCIL